MDGCRGCDNKISVYHSSGGQPPSAPEQMKSDVENQRHVTLLHGMWDLDQTCVPCIGRQILNHWATREVLHQLWFSPKF